MKINCGLMLKRGDGDYGSAAPSCSIELDVPDEMAKNTELLRQQIRNLQTICRVSCEEELEILLPKAKSAVPIRQAGDDVEDDQAGEDLQPGDRGYVPHGGDYDRDDPGPNPYRGRDVRPQPRNDAMAVYNGQPDRQTNDRRPAPRRDDLGRGGGGGGAKRYGPPRSAKAFCGWFQSLNDSEGGKDTKDEVYRILRAWDLPLTLKQLTDDEAVSVYNEVMNAKHDAVRSGNANGRSWGDGGNGRDDRGRR